MADNPSEVSNNPTGNDTLAEGEEIQEQTPQESATQENSPQENESQERGREPSAELTAAQQTPSAAKPKVPIQIGSRRDVAAGPRGAAPQVAKPATPLPSAESLMAEEIESPAVTPAVPIPPASKGPVPVPSKRARNDASDLDAEISAALGDFSLDEILESERTQQAATPLELDQRCRSTVVRIHRDNVFFSLTGRNEGVASVRQFDVCPEIGAQVDVIIRKYNNDDGIYEVSVPGASVSVSDWSDLEDGAVVEAVVTGSNTGGLECTINNIRGFIPASQVALYHVDALDEFVGQKLRCVVTEANPHRRNLVLSRRALLEREREEQRKSLLAEIEVGQQREGVVSRILDFGAFVDLGGIDGLIHISQLSWDRVNHPSEVLEEGQKVKVRVDKIDPQTGKIGLVYRDIADHPWNDINQRFSVNSIVKGVVSRVAKFGAFVRIAPGVEGLVHISELAYHRVSNVSSVVQEGQEVEVKILSIDEKEQRIGLSIKAAQAKPEQSEGESEAEEEEPPRDPAVKQHHGPLKGGVDRPSDGGNFGLNW